MSRIQKYNESLQRFIKDKSCLFEDQSNKNLELSNYIYNQIQNNDLIFSILLLTVLNNQNKKNKIAMQGYYLASSIEFMNILLNVIEKKQDVVNLFNDQNTYMKLYSNLIIYVNKSLQQNLESIKNVYNIQHQSFIGNILTSLNLYNDTFLTLNQFSDFQLNITNKNCHNSIIQWYLKDNEELINKFKTFKQVKKESLHDYIEKRYVILCELAISVALIIGGGYQIKDNSKIKRLSKYFAMMYKMAKDFENLDDDIKNNENHTTNYILNFGLQEAYEVFLNNKQKFIEESMVEEIYTTTIKEIIDVIEINVDMIIDQTSPDLKSSYNN